MKVKMVMYLSERARVSASSPSQTTITSNPARVWLASESRVSGNRFARRRVGMMTLHESEGAEASGLSE